MSVFDKVITGKQAKPFRLLIHGQAGVGKSSFAADAPAPLFLDCERRTNHLDVARLEIDSWETLVLAFGALYKEAQAGEAPYKTVVLDTLDHAELMLWTKLCEKNNWDSLEDPGYGKGYNATVPEWQRLKAAIENLQDVGINVILIAHSEVRPFQNPEGDNWDKYSIKLHRKGAGIMTEIADAVGFARFEDAAVKKKGDLKAKAVSTGERVISFEHSPAYDSKPGLGLESTIPLSWEEFANGLG